MYIVLVYLFCGRITLKIVGGLDDTDDDELSTSVAELSLFSGSGDTTSGGGAVRTYNLLNEWTLTAGSGYNAAHFSGPVFIFSR